MMMYMWRITKYNPEFRNSNGVFIKDDWSSYSDIGKMYQGKMFTTEVYQKYENMYVDAIITLMRGSKLSNLRLVDLEIYEEINKIDSSLILDEAQIKELVPEVLKERAWCKLEHANLFFVHFGYDYNMYIGSSCSCKEELRSIQESGLYVEEFESPYLQRQGFMKLTV